MSSKKEINYFNKFMPADLNTPNWNYGKSIDWYHSYFQNRQVNQICGEFSPAYMINTNVVEEVYNYNPRIKLIAILRDPIERLISLYNYRRQIGNWQFRTFEQAVDHFPQFLSLSLYYEQLKGYFDLFPHEQIKVLLFDDLKRNNKAFLLDVYSFLNIEPFFPSVVEERSNITADVRNQKINYFIGQVRLYIHRKNLHFLLPILRQCGVTPAAEYVRDRLNVSRGRVRSLTSNTVLSKDARSRLALFFGKDIEKLEELIGRDLSHWKSIG